MAGGRRRGIGRGRLAAALRRRRNLRALLSLRLDEMRRERKHRQLIEAAAADYVGGGDFGGWGCFSVTERISQSKNNSVILNRMASGLILVNQ